VEPDCRRGIGLGAHVLAPASRSPGIERVEITITTSEIRASIRVDCGAVHDRSARVGAPGAGTVRFDGVQVAVVGRDINVALAVYGRRSDVDQASCRIAPGHRTVWLHGIEKRVGAPDV